VCRHSQMNTNQLEIETVGGSVMQLPSLFKKLAFVQISNDDITVALLLGSFLHFPNILT
jgi:hypothetical protein